MLVDANGSFMTQRKAPTMTFIQPRIEDAFLLCSAPGMADIKIPIDPPKEKLIKCR
jgi:hypothetical protein